MFISQYDERSSIPSNGFGNCFKPGGIHDRSGIYIKKNGL